MPNNLPRLEKAIKRIIWEQKHKAPNESQNYVQWLQKIDVFFTGLTAIASVGSLLGIAFYYGLNNSTNEASGFLVGLHAALFLFTVNILLGICFAFNRFVLHAGILKWIVNLLILISAAAYFFPAASNWFGYISSKEFLFFSLTSYSLVFLSAKALDLANSYRMNPSLILASSFIVVIFIGTFLLMLPKSTKEPIDLIDAFFISTSAVCVTGLSPIDISQIFTNFGLLVLSVLIQIGGLGLIAFTSVFAIFYAGSTSVYNQLLIRDMIYSKSMDALLPTLLYILGFTLSIETIGAFLIYVTVPSSLFTTLSDKLIFSAFHSMSAFCNAGFSNLKDGLSNEVLLKGNQFFYLVICALMFLGSIGFPILINLKDKLFWKLKNQLFLSTEERTNFIRFDLNTKLVLITSSILVAAGTVLFLIFEYDGTLKDMSFFTKIVQSLFNAILPRTTGFASVNPADFQPSTILLVCLLMWIGGSSQSMAGGVKVNTVAVLFLNLKGIITGSDQTGAFHRAISEKAVLRAYAVAFIATVSVFVFSFILILLEPGQPIRSIIFEVMSALFTVGSSLGLTPVLSGESKFVLCIAMFLGRVGLLSILIGLLGHRGAKGCSFPNEHIIIN